MATMKCKTCGVGDSIAFCCETGAPICAKCAVSCDVCESPLSRERVQLTSTGRKLCSKCMAERAARRKAKKEEMRREGKGEREKPRAASPAPAAPAGLGGGVSFEDLMRDEPSLAAGMQAVKREEAPRKPESEERPDEAPVSAGTSFEDLMSSGPKAPSAEKSTRKAALEGVAQEGSKRLELGPIDDKRPILTASGHQGPGKMAYTAAFLFFGIAGAIFWTVVPGIREIMMPWQSVTPDFISDQRAVINDTNALRNASNISQFDVFSQGPVFFTAWFIFLAYFIGFVMIVWSVGRSLIDSYLAKRRLKKAEEYAKKHGVPYPQ